MTGLPAASPLRIKNRDAVVHIEIRYFKGRPKGAATAKIPNTGPIIGRAQNVVTMADLYAVVRNSTFGRRVYATERLKIPDHVGEVWIEYSNGMRVSLDSTYQGQIVFNEHLDEHDHDEPFIILIILDPPDAF